VLGELPDLQTLALEAQEKWAFHTFARLKMTVGSPAGSTGLVCGFTSARHGEGRSTWIRLLAGTARKQGYEVVVIATFKTQPTSESDNQSEDSSFVGEGTGKAVAKKSQPMQLSMRSLNEAQVLAIPAEAAWGLENRVEWQQGIQELGKASNRVVLVEFPPASEPETVLLAEKFPNLVWVCGRDMATGPEVQNLIKTLNATKANLVGAVLNFSET
jgi:hypothetical protein